MDRWYISTHWTVPEVGKVLDQNFFQHFRIPNHYGGMNSHRKAPEDSAILIIPLVNSKPGFLTTEVIVYYTGLFDLYMIGTCLTFFFLHTKMQARADVQLTFCFHASSVFPYTKVGFGPGMPIRLNVESVRRRDLYGENITRTCTVPPGRFVYTKFPQRPITSVRGSQCGWSKRAFWIDKTRRWECSFN